MAADVGDRMKQALRASPLDDALARRHASCEYGVDELHEGSTPATTETLLRDVLETDPLRRERPVAPHSRQATAPRAGRRIAQVFVALVGGVRRPARHCDGAFAQIWKAAALHVVN
ncbi:hypothetical protein SCARD494_03153 [Seiridium cardinale]